MSTYILQKDIEQPNDHCLKAGTKFVKKNNDPDSAYVSECGRRSFHPNVVENKSSWFLKETEQPSEQFVWTDELVAEFTTWSLTASPALQGRYADIEQFKQSKVKKEEPKQSILNDLQSFDINEEFDKINKKWEGFFEYIKTQSPKESPLPIKVIVLERMFGSTGGTTTYSLVVKDEIPDEKYEPIKKAIESVLNPVQGQWDSIDEIIKHLPKTYTSDELLAAQSRAFYAARETYTEYDKNGVKWKKVATYPAFEHFNENQTLKQ